MVLKITVVVDRGSFSSPEHCRRFSESPLAKNHNSENIRAEYRNGVLTLHMAKREESKRKQIKISVSANAK
jgi:HSP20 family molecular chaperone IbpA